MSCAALIVIVVFIEAFLHYFPWRLVLGRKIPRLAAYTLGVLGMMGPFTAWLVEQGHDDVAMVLWMVIAAGGLSVMVLYALDWVVQLAWSKREAEEREQAALAGMKAAIHAKE